MRGRERIRTVAVFILATTSSATLIGFGTGAALGWMPDPTPAVVGSFLLAALVTDLVHRRTGRFAPWRIDGQVPREWGRLFSPPVVALLYGTRLGVGPLTLLPTWLWWAVTALAAAGGAAVGALVGATFGLVRAGSILVVSLSGEHHRPGRGWVAELRTRDPYRAVTLTCALAMALTLSACGAEQAEPLPVAPSDPADPTTTPADPPNTTPAPTTTDHTEGTPAPSSAMTQPDDIPPPPTASRAAPTPPPTPPPPAAPASPVQLAAVLIESVPGFTPLDTPDADRWLDLRVASERQPDPADELALLQTRGYGGGWNRVFRNDTQDIVMTTVYEFRSAADAAFYLQDGMITIGGYGGQLFEVEGFPEARGFRQDTGDAAGPLVTYGLTFTEANRWYLVFVFGDPQTVTADIAVDAARRQLDRARDE